MKTMQISVDDQLCLTTGIALEA